MKKSIFALAIILVVTSFTSLKRATFVSTVTNVNYTNTTIKHQLAGADGVHNYYMAWKVWFYHPIFGLSTGNFVNMSTMIPSTSYIDTRVYTHQGGAIFDHIEIVDGPYMMVD